MDKTLLVDKDIEDGKRLVEALDISGFPVTSALWFYLTDSDEWRLLLASPWMVEKGPKKTYALIQSVIAESEPPLSILLKRISVMNPENKLIQLLRTAITTEHELSEIRFTRNTINNIFIEDALIYRLTARHQPSKR